METSEGEQDGLCSSYEQFVLYHEAQLKKSGVPDLFWPSLFHKLQNDIWDLAGRIVVNRVYEASEETGPEDDETEEQIDGQYKTAPFPRVFCGDGDMSSNDPQSIFLVDHAWTFEVISARSMLRSFPALLQRMCNIMDIETTAVVRAPLSELDKEERRQQLIECVLQSMWKFVNTYSFNSALLTAEDKLPRWYIHDEIGCRIAHCDQANCRLVPFYHIPAGMTYSLLFPIADIESGQELSRNYVEGLPSNLSDDGLYRQCRLLPWQPVQLPPDISYEPQLVPLDYFRNSALSDSLPPTNAAEASLLPTKINKKGGGGEPILVFSEYEVLTTFLTDKRFKISDTASDAHILWYSRHFNDFKGLAVEFPDKLINQFPYESVVTVKDLLAIVCRRTVADGQALINRQTLQSLPPWLATTYNLESDLVNFVAYFLQRQERQMNNLWICKPWNLARSMDMVISDNLSTIVRLPETGPKLCCKYIEEPVLFHRPDVLEGPVKFDLRFIVALHSVQPLRLAMYQHFWLRFANKAFSLSDFDVYDKHFTVMNYGQGPIHQMFCQDFVQQFNEQNSGHSWGDVQKDIYGIVRQVFEAATCQPPPAGIAVSPQSRGVYGLDFMLKWNQSPGDAMAAVQPVLLEVNYSPDCQRACDYYPDFYNDVFAYLFLNETPQTIVPL